MEDNLKLGQQLSKRFREKTGQKIDYYFEKYRIKLIWYLMKKEPDRLFAEEVADETFIKAFYDIEKFNGDKGQFSTWLFTIAKNILIQKIKIKNKFQSIDKEYNGSGSTLADFLESDDDFYKDVKNDSISKKIELVKEEMSKLPEKYAMVLIMREIDNLSYQEIADILDFNLNTVKSQIKQGREILVKKLTPKFKKLREIDA